VTDPSEMDIVLYWADLSRMGALQAVDVTFLAAFHVARQRHNPYQHGNGGHLFVPSASGSEHECRMHWLASSSIDLVSQMHCMSESEHDDLDTAVIKQLA